MIPNQPLKFKQRYAWPSHLKDHKYDLSDAVIAEMSSDGGREGRIESMAAELDQSQRMVGRIVEMLYENGALTREQIESLLPSFTVEDPK